MDLKQEILSAASRLFQSQKLNFTMQQIAEQLHISKKTIYTVYPGKEALLLDMVDMLFSKIHERKRELAQSEMPLPQRLRSVLIALPEEYAAMDFRQLDTLEEKYPVVAQRVRSHLETGWEPTLALLEEGVRQGTLRNVNPRIFRRVLTAGFESLLSGASQGSSYAADLEDMMDIIMNGLQN